MNVPKRFLRVPFVSEGHPDHFRTSNLIFDMGEGTKGSLTEDVLVSDAVEVPRVERARRRVQEVAIYSPQDQHHNLKFQK